MVLDILEINVLINSYYGYLDNIIVTQSLLSKDLKSILNENIDCYLSGVKKRLAIIDDKSKLQYLIDIKEDAHGNSSVSRLFTLYYKFDLYLNSR
jgi:hypothetical protein